MYTSVSMTATTDAPDLPPTRRRADWTALPKGRYAAPREFVFQSQRERMLEAMAFAVAEKGYAATTVADVVARAGVSRKTFYEQFANKEACFFAAYDAGVELLIEDLARAIAGAGDWWAALQAGTRRYLDAMAENGAFARTFLIEILAVGPDSLERRAAVHQRFADLLAAAHNAARGDLPPLPEIPERSFRACVGAINELVTDHLTRRSAETLPELLDELIAIQLALFTGPSVEGLGELVVRPESD